MTLQVLSPQDLMAKRQYGTGSLRQRKNSAGETQWEIGYRTRGGRQKWERVGPDKEVAEDLLLQRLLEMRTRDEDAIVGVRFKALAKAWLEEKETGGVRPKTVELWKGIISCHLLPALGEDFIHQLDYEGLMAYRNAKLKGYHTDEDGNQVRLPVSGGATPGQPLSPQTVAHHLTVLRGIFDLAMKRRLVDVNVAKLVSRPKIERPHVQPLATSEVKRLLKAVDPEYRTLLLLLVATGLRISEATALLQRDWNDKTHKLRIDGAIKRNGGKLYRDRNPKNAAARRTITVGEELAKALTAQKKRAAAGRDPAKLGLLFPNRSGMPINPSNLRNRVFKPAAQKAKIIPTDAEAAALRAKGQPVKKLRLHDLRHTYASEQLARGVPASKVQQRGGWANPASLAIYSHATSSAEDEVADSGDLYE